MPYPRYAGGSPKSGYPNHPSPWQSSGLLPTPGATRSPSGDQFGLFAPLLGSSSALAGLAGHMAMTHAFNKVPGESHGGRYSDYRDDSPFRSRGGTDGRDYDSSYLRGPDVARSSRLGRDHPVRDIGSSRQSRYSPPGRGRPRSRSRSPQRFVGNNRSAGTSRRARSSANDSSSSNISRPEFEIYIGNYPQDFNDLDVRKLFDSSNIKIKSIRMKNEGRKVFAFVETVSKDEIEKAIQALDDTEIKGRKLRVRSANERTAVHHKDSRSGPKRRRVSRSRSASDEPIQVPELRVSDTVRNLVYSFNTFLRSQAEAEIKNVTTAEESERKERRNAKEAVKATSDETDPEKSVNHVKVLDEASSMNGDNVDTSETPAGDDADNIEGQTTSEEHTDEKNVSASDDKDGDDDEMDEEYVTMSTERRATAEAKSRQLLDIVASLVTIFDLPDNDNDKALRVRRKLDLAFWIENRRDIEHTLREIEVDKRIVARRERRAQRDKLEKERREKEDQEAREKEGSDEAKDKNDLDEYEDLSAGLLEGEYYDDEAVGDEQHENVSVVSEVGDEPQCAVEADNNVASEAAEDTQPASDVAEQSQPVSELNGDKDDSQGTAVSDSIANHATSENGEENAEVSNVKAEDAKIEVAEETVTPPPTKVARGGSPARSAGRARRRARGRGSRAR